jgi:hypothetical protein
MELADPSGFVPAPPQEPFDDVALVCFHYENEIGAAGHFTCNLACPVIADIDPDFRHGHNRMIMGLVAVKRVGACRGDIDALFQLVRQAVVEQASSHGTAAYIAGTDHEDFV